MVDRLPEDDPRLERILLSGDQIRERVQELAADIAREFQGESMLHMVGVLKGACVFMSDLGREIRRAGGPRIEYDFIRASTYGGAIKADGEKERHVQIEGLPQNVRGRHILLVEDILDQGFTLSAVRRALLETYGAAAVRLCVLLDKELDNPSDEVVAIRKGLVPDFCGFRIPDRWVAGYGLDVNEEFRDLPYVAIVREEYFQD